MTSFQQRESHDLTNLLQYSDTIFSHFASCIKRCFFSVRILYRSEQILSDLKLWCNCCCCLSISLIVVGIQPFGRFRQRPELSQATVMALVRCILGKFLGVVCHCFPPRLDVPTYATRYLHVRHNAIDPSGGRWNCGPESCPVILPK